MRMCFSVLFRFAFIIIVSQPSYEILQPLEAENSSSMSACLTVAGSSPSETKISILYSSEYESLISSILKMLKVPVVINAVERIDYNKSDTVLSSSLVMIFGHYNTTRVLSESLWNSKTRFLFLYKDEEELEKELPKFWDHKIINVFGIVNSGQKIEFYSYVPYMMGSCGLGKPILMGECVDGQFFRSDTWTEGIRRLTNLNACPVNITVAKVKPSVIFEGICGRDVKFKIDGFEGNLINEFAEKMNFQAVYRCSPEGIGWLKPSPGGAIGSVFKGESEFALGMMGPAVERFYSLDLSTGYNEDECLTFCVPRGAGHRNVTEFEFFVFEFDLWTWLLLLIVLLIFLIFFYLSNFYLKEKWMTKKLDISMELFAVVMGLPAKNPFYSSKRVSLVFLVIFSLIMTVAYKSEMGSRLTVPNEDPNINSFEQLLESNLELVGSKNMQRFLQFNDIEDPVVAEMINRFVVASFGTTRAFQLIATGRKIAYLRYKSTFLYQSFVNPAAAGHIHIIRECLILFHPSVIARKNSFFTERLNEMIKRLEEAGIMGLWRSKYMYKVSPPAQPLKPLTTDRFYSLFWITTFCYALAILCFALEISAGAYGRKRRRESSGPSETC